MTDNSKTDVIRSPLLRCALDTVEEVFLVCRTDGEILQWNSRLEEVTGYSGPELSERTPASLIGKEARQIERHLVEADGGQRVKFEARLETKEQGPVPYAFTASLFRQSGDALICLAGRKERYRRIFEEALEGIAITTPEGNILRANPAARDMFGYREEEVPALNLVDLYADPEKRKEILVALRREGAISQREARFQRAGGEEMICELSVTAQYMDTPRGEGDFGRHLAFFRDVTEQKRAEEALKESEEKFRTLAEGALVGIVLVREGAYEYVNPAFADIVGRTPEELEGQSPEEVVLPEDWPKVQENMKERMDGTRDAVYYQVRLLAGSGDDESKEIRYAEVQGSQITYQGTPALIATVQDVTERRRLQREVIQVQEEERRRIGKELHDRVATQLTGARFMLSSLLDRVEEEPVAGRIQRSLEIIEEGFEVARRLTRGLSPGGLSEGDLPAALHGLAQNTEGTRFESLLDEEDFREPNCFEKDHFRSKAGGIERRLASILEAETATHLYRIAQEAVANALFHGQAGDIVICLRQEEGDLLLEIEDDGMGFEPSGLDGEGLGLRSMRYRAELIDADLTVESSRGKGTLVRCRLPL